jgi:hypothetical protein
VTSSEEFEDFCDLFGGSYFCRLLRGSGIILYYLKINLFFFLEEIWNFNVSSKGKYNFLFRRRHPLHNDDRIQKASISRISLFIGKDPMSS